jgi:hypothetical protein
VRIGQIEAQDLAVSLDENATISIELGPRPAVDDVTGEESVIEAFVLDLSAEQASKLGYLLRRAVLETRSPGLTGLTESQPARRAWRDAGQVGQ